MVLSRVGASSAIPWSVRVGVVPDLSCLVGDTRPRHVRSVPCLGKALANPYA